LAFNRLSHSQFRLIGIFPLIFFSAQAIHYWRIHELGHMLWMCNIGNLLLAIGLFFEQVIFIRVAILWMLPGLVVWFFYVFLTWGLFLTRMPSGIEFEGVVASTLAHVGGIAVSVVALRRVGMDRTAWLYAFIWYFVMQLLCRLLTPVAINVNLSQKIQDGWEQRFTTYWKFWLVLSALIGVGAWIVGRILNRIWPGTTAPCREDGN
jgi:hypothetical protein